MLYKYVFGIPVHQNGFLHPVFRGISLFIKHFESLKAKQ